MLGDLPVPEPFRRAGDAQVRRGLPHRGPHEALAAAAETGAMLGM
jgi:hypothetical protein